MEVEGTESVTRGVITSEGIERSCDNQQHHPTTNTSTPNMQAAWNMWRLYEMLATPEATVEFCQKRGLLASDPVCKRCRKALSWYAKPNYRESFVWRCNRWNCRSRAGHRSIRRGTWFADSKMSLRKILVLTYCWAKQMSNKVAIRESSVDDGVTSSETVNDWFTFCREVCLNAIKQNSTTAIGGPGKVIEMDEAKFCPRKYGGGGVRDVKWVLGGICRETKEVFLIEISNRDAATLATLIKQYVAAGSTIVTDCWRSYECLCEENLRNLLVDHSVNFKDPGSGANSQNLECQWWKIKQSLSSVYCSEGFGFHVAEYMWRRKHSGIDYYEQILKDISLLYVPLKSL